MNNIVKQRVWKYSALCLLLSVASGCASTGVDRGVTAARGDGPGSRALVVNKLHEPVRNLPKSRIGNPPTYSVFGQQYRVLESAHDFRQNGTASWYGKKFHGRATSSGEIYNMHQLTAAHKNLPLPTYVRVTHQDNGLSVIVKVNDRGPFVGDRIIDLSYAAALQIDMIGSGTAPVQVEALSTHVVEIATAMAPHYIQLGAFSHQPNAESLLDRIAGAVPVPVRIDHDEARALYRVRLGPVVSEATLNDTIVALASAGIDSYTMVSAGR